MTFDQLRYIVALDSERNFVRAAEKCFITQPALTIQIQKLEEELGVIIFDRSKKPLIPTDIGRLIIEQAKFILQEVDKIRESVKEYRQDLSGELKLGIIPTLAPYLVPLFINDFLARYPRLEITIIEKQTEAIIAQLKNGDLDAGIFVTPWNDPQIRVAPIFYEMFYVYVSPQHPLFKKKRITYADLTPDDIWLLEEGNCFRNQVINICQVKPEKEKPFFRYESASIEALKKIVETRAGVTLIPELALSSIADDNRFMLRSFKKPVPVREVSLVTSRSYVKKRVLEKLKETITKHIPETMHSINGRELVHV